MAIQIESYDINYIVIVLRYEIPYHSQINALLRKVLKLKLKHILINYPFTPPPERFNETIFDALPTYLLNICEVCGSSQCPYCTIYNLAVRHSTSALLLLSTAVVVVLRQLRLGQNIQNSFLWNQ